MKKIHLKYPVIVEGKYDKIKLSNILSSSIISIGGFSFMNDKNKKKLLSTLSEESKLIILTDSDKAGAFIRSKLKGIIRPEKLIHLHIPQIKGKEKRKTSASAENLLGVEGMEADVLLKLLLPYEEKVADKVCTPVTTAIFWEYGLSGKSDSDEKRKKLATELGLPNNLTAKGLISAINSIGGKERFLEAAQNLFSKGEISSMEKEKAIEYTKNTISFYTLGCRVNQYETRGVAEQLYKAGFKIVPFGENSEFSFINTCAVTGESERKSLVSIKKASNLSKHVIVSGCYSEHNPQKVSKIKNVSFVCGCAEKERCVGAIKRLADMGEDFSPLSICTTPPESFPFVSSCRAYVKIQDGCNGNCTYCLIHKLRGKSTVRNIEEILCEATRLAEAGYKEIILTGIEISAFGNKNLSELISKLGNISQIKRIRLGSLDPRVLTEEFIQTIKNTPSFMPHLHLSVQSPNSRILKLMKRPYNGDQLRNRIDALRKAIPEIMLSADIITSFPTETEEEFEESLEFVKEYKLLHVHSFSFSPRPGTEAYDMEGKIPYDDAKMRNKKMIETSKEIKESLLSQKIGGLQEVLIESYDGKYYKGHTKDFSEALVKPKENMIYHQGDIITVIPLSVKDDYLICKGE